MVAAGMVRDSDTHLVLLRPTPIRSRRLAVGATNNNDHDSEAQLFSSWTTGRRKARGVPVNQHLIASLAKFIQIQVQVGN